MTTATTIDYLLYQRKDYLITDHVMPCDTQCMNVLDLEFASNIAVLLKENITIIKFVAFELIEKHAVACAKSNASILYA